MDSAVTTTPSTPAKRNGSINWKEQVKRRIFILSWIRKYNTQAAIGDAIAGTTLENIEIVFLSASLETLLLRLMHVLSIGLTIIPQCMAFASLAGLPTQYGLYSSFVGSLLYVIFGTVKEVSIGPTALLSLLTFQYTSDKPIEYVILLTFLTGCIILLVGVLNLGLIVDFISVPITNAFTTATLLYVICSQLKHILGIDYSSKGFFHSLYQLIIRIKECTLWDSILGLSCCLVLILFRLLKYIKIKSNTSSAKTLTRFLCYLSEASSLLIVIVTSCIAYQWIEGTAPFQLSGTVEPGIPHFMLPSFKIENTNKTIGFIQICTDLGSGLVVVPLVAIVLNISIAKAYNSGKILDVSQEMFTLGMCNILGSFFSSMPTSGGFNRSVVSSSSGVRSPLSGVYSATLILLALTFLTPYCYLIPKATLASILIVTAALMLDFKLPIHLWGYSKRDFWPWIGCIIVCLAVNVQIGVLFGICFNMLQLLYMWARPNIILEVNEIDNMQFVRVSPSMGMYFPGIVKLREIVNNEMLRTQFKFPVVINCIRLTGLDYTAAQGINGLTSDLQIQKQVLVIQNLDTKLEKWLISSDNLRICRRDQILREVIKDIYSEHQSQL